MTKRGQTISRSLTLTSIGLQDELERSILDCVERVLVALWTAALGDLARMRLNRTDGRAKRRQECAVRVHAASDAQHSILLFLFLVVLCETRVETVVKSGSNIKSLMVTLEVVCDAKVA